MWIFLGHIKRCISEEYGGLPRWLSSKPLANTGDGGSTPRSPGGENGNPLQYSCLGNAMDTGAGQATVMGLQRVGHDWVSTHAHMGLFI